MGKKQPFDEFEVRELSDEKRHWRSSFDSRFLRVFALNGKPRTCLITHVAELHSKGDGESKMQLLITLQEFDKPWAINVTNSETIATLYANDDPHSWVGKRVTLYPTKTKFGREVVDCIRVRDQIPQDAADKMTAKQAVRQAPNMPPKPKQRPEVMKHIQNMADATLRAHLDTVEEELTADNSLTQEETAFLVQALIRRRAQLEALPSGDAPDPR